MRLMQLVRKWEKMVIIVENVLGADHLTLLTNLMSGLNWRDGSITAGPVAKQVKRNLQADLSSAVGAKIEDMLFKAIKEHAVIKAAAQPHRMSRPLVSKTEPGGGYGWHIDNPFMSAGETSFRTDLSFTLFVSSPGDYEGGELVIDQSGQTQSVKLNAGSLVIYPATCLHRVADVTSGTRLVCAGWIESRIQRADDRETIFDLLNLQAELSKTHDLQSNEMLILSKTIANLRRRFD